MNNREKYNGGIADNIRRLRKDRQWSQEALASKLQILGIDYSSARISQVELKKRPPTAILVVALKCLFACEYSDLLGEVEQGFNRILDGQ